MDRLVVGWHAFLSQLSWRRSRLRPRFMAILVALLMPLAFALAGCQSLGWPNPQPSPGGKVHLTLWQGVNPPPNRVVLQKLVERFNQTHPQIELESLYIGQGDQQLPKLLAAAVGNALPDLLWYAPVLTGQLVEWGAVRSLDAEWAQSKTSGAVAQLDPALEASTLLEGHHWSVPFSTNNIGIYYRPSLFKAAGITQLPKTWPELRQVAQRLTRDTNGDGQIDQHGLVLPLGKGEWTVFTWLPFMWSAQGEIPPGSPVVKTPPVNTPVNTPVVNTPEAVAALVLWRDLLREGTAILSGPERGYELDGLIAGKVAMQLSGPWTLAQLEASGVDFGVLPIPVGQTPATIIGGENLFLMPPKPGDDPAKQQAAWTFAEYVLGEAFQTEWAIGTGYLPINLKSRQSKAYQAFRAQQPAVDVFLDQAKYGRSRPIAPGYNRISESLGRAIESVLLGKTAPKVALDEAQQRLDLIFKP